MPTLNNLNVVFVRDRNGNFTPINGLMGSPGRGIVSIERTSGDGTSGSIDVYTITYTDKTTSTFEVYNGSDGESGATPEQIAAAIEQYLSENPFVKKETDPTVFRWAKAELFDKNALVDPAGRNSFVTIDDIEYYRYNASAQNFEWNNPNPQTGSVAITARGVSQYGGTGSTRLRIFFDDGTEGEPLFIIVNGESRTVTYTTPSDKVLAKITGNYDMENWVLLDMSVMSCMADYPAPKGTVKTVNGISPDGNGNIQFDAADVNAVAQNQGAENAGKFMGVNESGEVVPVDAPSGGSGTDIALGISGAAVGQIAKVKAVDASGAPTEWEAADIPIVDNTLTMPGEAADAAIVGQKLTEQSEAIADKLDASKLPEAINTALAQAKESGEFNGKDGKDGSNYVLTEYDKTEIAQKAAGLVDTALLSIIGSGVTA